MIKIAFTGDIMLARRVGDTLKNNPEFKILDDDLEQFLVNHDFVVGNLECAVSVHANKLKRIGFKANPNALQQLSSFNLFSFANNHIFDCGKQGAIDTIQYVLKNNQNLTGFFNEVDNYFFATKIKNKTFTFLSCAVAECIKDPDIKEYPKVQEAENPHILCQIKTAKDISNYVIVLVHGGDEMIPFPNPNFRNLCESFIDCGADVVITHHPHVLGGVHCYKNKFIFYSLGDFIFDGESCLRRRGLILSMSFHENRIFYQILPTQIRNNLSVGLPNYKIKSIIERKWLKVSTVLQLDEKYNSKYKTRYIKSLLIFQFDRLFFLLKTKGILYLLKFVLKRIELLPLHLKKIATLNF